MTVEHNQLIQKEFTKQAEAYAFNPSIIDPDWAMRLVRAVQPAPQDKVLEVATGPGYVALAFATQTSEVVGVDLTQAPLAIAEKNRQDRGLTNVQFKAADANQLPFEDNTFDVAVCRLAFHHFATPKQVLAEMVRVCRPGGKIAVEDLISSEYPERAEYYNQWERLRDPSHTTALTLSQFLAMFTEAGLEIENIQTEHRIQVVEQWMRNSQTPPETAEEIRQLLTQDYEKKLSGLHIFYNDDGDLCFDHRMHIVIGLK